MDYKAWIKKHQKITAVVASAIVVICFSISVGFSRVNEQKKVNVEARALFEAWQADFQAENGNEKKSLKKLAKMLNKYPFLQRRYDSLIAQTMINAGRVDGMDVFATRAISQNENPYLKMYSMASCLIAANDLKAAADLSQQLDQELKSHETKEVETYLQLLNLHRLAVLFEAQENRDQAGCYYQELKEALESKKNNPSFKKGVDQFLASFDEKGFSFEDYLAIKAL